MFRTVVVIASVLGCFVMAMTQSFSQASKQLDERAKKVATPQRDSWKQVDEINQETDKTKSLYQQAQQSGTHAGQKSTYIVKKSTAGSGNAYKKPSPPKKRTSPKKK